MTLWSALKLAMPPPQSTQRNAIHRIMLRMHFHFRHLRNLQTPDPRLMLFTPGRHCRDRVV